MKTIKNTCIYSAFFLLALLCNLSANAQKTAITFAELPKTAQVFLETHFADQWYEYLLKDNEDLSVDYTVKLNNGTEVRFDDKGDWKEVDGNKNTIPVNVLPAPINDYLSTNHSNILVTRIERDKRGYEVKLNNGLELIFNLKGKFLKIDE